MTAATTVELTRSQSTEDALKLAKEVCTQKCSDIMRTSKMESVNACVVGGGITNNLIRVWNSAHPTACCLVRIFGENSGRIIDRSRERLVVDYLWKFGIGKQVYERFQCGTKSGQIEEWVEGTALTSSEIASPSLIPLIARAVAKLHSVPLPSDTDDSEACKILLGGADDDPTASPGTVKSALWPQLWRYFSMCKSACEFADEPKKKRLRLINFAALEEEAKLIEDYSRSVNSTVVLCHVDLLGGNILKRVNGSIAFIDFEYAQPLERAFDLANHFNEYSGFECDWGRFPRKEKQVSFLREYAAHINAEVDVDVLRKEMEAFILVSHLFWGIWAILQSIKSDLDFDFWSYSHRRLSALYHPTFRSPFEHYCDKMKLHGSNGTTS